MTLSNTDTFKQKIIMYMEQSVKRMKLSMFLVFYKQIPRVNSIRNIF